MDVFSTIFSLLGFGQKHAHRTEDKRSEALSLNAELEATLNRVENFLNLRKIKILHETAYFAEKFDMDLEGAELAFERFEADIAVGRATVEKSYEAIRKSSAFASLRKWEEVTLTLRRQVLAANEMKMHVEASINRMDELLAQMAGFEELESCSDE